MRVECRTTARTAAYIGCALLISGCAPAIVGSLLASTGGGGGSSGGAGPPLPFTTDALSMVPDHGPAAGGTMVEVFVDELPASRRDDELRVFVGGVQLPNDGSLYTSIRLLEPLDSPTRYSVSFTTPPNPAGNLSGPVAVRIEGPFRVRNVPDFTYEARALNGGAMSPTTGLGTGGELVSIHGEGFAGAMRVVMRRGAVEAEATVQSVTDTELVVLTPPFTSGFVDVVVQHPDGSTLVLPFFQYRPCVTAARYEDQDQSGTVDAGDFVIVVFNEAVRRNFAQPSDFALPVAGDSFGAGATVTTNGQANELRVTLGTAPQLTHLDAFDATNLGPGSPTGIDVSSGMAANAIEGFDSGVDVVPSTPADLARVAFVPGQTLSPLTLTVELGDLDGDGDLDLGEAGWDTEAVVRLWENVNGTFVLRNTLPGANYTVRFGDLDDDGDLDVVMPSAVSGVYFNEGAWSFTAQGLPLSGDRVRLADMDGDGDLDVVGGSGGIGCYVAFNDGAGAFTAGPVQGTRVTQAVAVGDLDRDGDLDLIRVSGAVEVTQYIERWINDGAGALTHVGDVMSGDGLVNAALGDIDADGDLDLVAIRTGGGAPVFQNGPAGFVLIATLADPGGSFMSLDDYDGDGDLDAVSCRVVWLGTGTATFRDSGIRLQPTSPVDSVAGALGDLDGDGDADFVLGFWPLPGTATRVYRNTLIGD